MPVLPNGQMLPYNNLPSMSVGQVYDPTGQYLRQITENYNAYTGQTPEMARLGQPGMQGAGGIFGNKLAGMQPQMQQPRFSQPQGAIPTPGTAPTQQGQQVDPRLQMWIQQQMQRRQAGEMPRFTQPMTTQDRMGMMGPGIASLRAGAQQGPTRLAGMQQGMSTGTSPQNLQGVQTGAQDLVTNRRRGILGGA